MIPLDLDTTLENVKLDLNIDDGVQDDLLVLLINKVCRHFKLSYGVDDIDEGFDFIIEDSSLSVLIGVARKVLRLNRLRGIL